MDGNTPATWIDHKGRAVLIHTMSNRWLNNIRKKYKGKSFIKPIIDEIKRRKMDNKLIRHYDALGLANGGQNPEKQNHTPVQFPSKFQVCPKCNGQGTVSKPSFVPGDVHKWESSSTSFICDVCIGAKLIPNPIELTSSLESQIEELSQASAELYSLKQSIWESALKSYMPKKEMSFHDKVVFAIDEVVSENEKLRKAEQTRTVDICDYTKQVEELKAHAKHLVEENVRLIEEKNKVLVQVEELKKQLEEIKKERTDQDAIIGSQIRKINSLEDTENKRIAWLQYAKLQWGVSTDESFENVWKECLKIKQQRDEALAEITHLRDLLEDK